MVLEKIIDFVNAYSFILMISLGSILLGLLLFLILPPLRGVRTRLSIKIGRLRNQLSHYWYSMIGVVRIFSAIKILILVLAGLGFLLFLILIVIDAWNMYITPYGLPQLGLPFPMWRILFVMSWILGALMSFFTKPKVKKFADKVNAKPSMFYIFGSNRLTEMLIDKLVSLGMGVRTALIAKEPRLWIENLPEEINNLILDNPEELRNETLYDILGFANAEKVIVLVEDPDLAGNIITNVRKMNPEVELTLLSNNKPPFLDLSAGQIQNVSIIEDTEAILRELTGKLTLGYERPNVISLPVPSAYVNNSPELFEKDFKKKLKVLGIKRNGEIKQEDTLGKEDHVLLYLKDSEVLGDLLQLAGLTVKKRERKQEAEKKKEKEEKEEIEEPEKKPEKKSTEELEEPPEREAEQEVTTKEEKTGEKEEQVQTTEEEDKPSKAFGKALENEEE